MRLQLFWILFWMRKTIAKLLLIYFKDMLLSTLKVNFFINYEDKL